MLPFCGCVHILLRIIGTIWKIVLGEIQSSFWLILWYGAMHSLWFICVLCNITEILVWAPISLKGLLSKQEVFNKDKCIFKYVICFYSLITLTPHLHPHRPPRPALFSVSQQPTQRSNCGPRQSGHSLALSNQGQKVTSELLGNKRLFPATKQRGPVAGRSTGRGEGGRVKGPVRRRKRIDSGQQTGTICLPSDLCWKQERKPPLRGQWFWAVRLKLE